MANRYEYYNTGDNSGSGFWNGKWLAQTFTPSVAHKITSVKLKLFRTGSPGTITVSIRATQDGKPTGGDLCAGTTNGNTLPTGPAGEWREITLGAGSDLNVGVKYATVVRAVGAEDPMLLRWRLDKTSPSYTNGNRVTSRNSGVDWFSTTTHDYMFEDWGEIK